MLLTTILLVPMVPRDLAGTDFAALLRGGRVLLWIPPTGAAALWLAAERRLEARRAPAERRWVERISSRDLSSLPDMMKRSSSGMAGQGGSPNETRVQEATDEPVTAAVESRESGTKTAIVKRKRVLGIRRLFDGNVCAD